MTLHIVTDKSHKEAETACGLETCRAAPRGHMRDRGDQPSRGDSFIKDNPEWSWCLECRSAVTSPTSQIGSDT